MLLLIFQAGDVAAKAGVQVSDADEALQALAFDTQGALEVSCACVVLCNVLSRQRLILLWTPL